MLLLVHILKHLNYVYRISIIKSCGPKLLWRQQIVNIHVLQYSEQAIFVASLANSGSCMCVCGWVCLCASAKVSFIVQFLSRVDMRVWFLQVFAQNTYKQAISLLLNLCVRQRFIWKEDHFMQYKAGSNCFANTPTLLQHYFGFFSNKQVENIFIWFFFPSFK